jgi:hypothetical protein
VKIRKYRGKAREMIQENEKDKMRNNRGEMRN